MHLKVAFYLHLHEKSSAIFWFLFMKNQAI